MRPLALLLSLASLGLLLAACGDPAPVPTARRVILISLDDVGAAHVGSYGYGRPTTPNLDRLVQQGIRFEHCIVNANWTLPSHMVMLTGTHPRRHGVVDHGHTEGPSVPLLTEVLKRARPEVKTAGFTDHSNLSKTFGFGRGFDEYHENKDERRPPSGILDPARAFLDAHPNDPCFLFLHLFTAHWPHLHVGDFPAKFDPDYHGKVVGAKVDIDRLSVELRTDDERRDFQHLEALYDAEIATLDQELGKFLAGIDLSQTLVIVTADHGEAFREHGYYGHGVSFEKEEIEVPLLLLGGPAAKSAGVRAGRAAEIDLAPTILAALGVRPDPAMEGLDLLGENVDLDRPLPLISESSLAIGQLDFDRFALWTPKWKLIWFPEVQRYEKTFGRVLYDLGADPGEQTNAASEHPEVVEGLEQMAIRAFGYQPRSAFLVRLPASAASQSGKASLSGPLRNVDILRMTTCESAGGKLVDWVRFARKENAVEFQCGRQSRDGAMIAGPESPNGIFLLTQKEDAGITVEVDGKSAPFERMRLLAFPDERSGKAPELPPDLLDQLRRTGYPLGNPKKTEKK